MGAETGDTPDGYPGQESQSGYTGRIQQVDENTYLIWPPGGGSPAEADLEMLMSADMALGDMYRHPGSEAAGDTIIGEDGDEGYQPPGPVTDPPPHRPPIVIADNEELGEPYL